MRALITGSGGFVGPYLANELESEGHDVYGIDRAAPSKSRFKTYQCDILDKTLLQKIMGKVRPEIVFHLAAISSIRDSWAHPEITKRVIVDGTKNLLEAVRPFKPVVLVVSSSDVYAADQSQPLSEDSSVEGVNPYSQARIQQEELCRAAEGQIIISRSFNHTGPGQQTKFVCPDLAMQFIRVANGETEAVYVGDVNIVRDFSDVRDVVKAYILLADRGIAGETYNVCSGEGRSIQNIIDILSDISGLSPEIDIDDSKKRKNDVRILIGGNSKIRKTTGWKPLIDFKQTLQDIYDYWRNK